MMLWESLINNELRIATLKLKSLNAHYRLGTSARIKFRNSRICPAFLSYAKSHGNKLISCFFYLTLAFWLHLGTMKLKASTTSSNYLHGSAEISKRKLKQWVSMGKAVSTPDPELQKWRTAQANPSVAGNQCLKRQSLQAQGEFGEGAGYPVVASQNFSSFQARKRLREMRWKQQLEKRMRTIVFQVRS